MQALTTTKMIPLQKNMWPSNTPIYHYTKTKKHWNANVSQCQIQPQDGPKFIPIIVKDLIPLQILWKKNGYDIACDRST